MTSHENESWERSCHYGEPGNDCGQERDILGELKLWGARLRELGAWWMTQDWPKENTQKTNKN